MARKVFETVLDHGYVLLRNIAGPVRRDDADFDAADTDPANVARFSFNNADDPNRKESDDLRLYEYLVRNSHNTPIEMIQVWLELRLPLFVARQFVRHRTASLNEVSARYVQLENLFYIPDPACVGVKSSTNKQGRTIHDMNTESSPSAQLFTEKLRENSQSAYREYESAIKGGIPNELARCFLPVNIYTKWMWRMDLHNMFHFLSLRLHSHAQYESRQYARAMYKILREVLPHSMELFDTYRRKEEV